MKPNRLTSHFLISHWDDSTPVFFSSLGEGIHEFCKSQRTESRHNIAAVLGMYLYVRPAPTLIQWLKMCTRPKVTNQPVEKLDSGDSTPEAMTVFYSSSSVCADGDADCYDTKLFLFLFLFN